MGPFPSSSKNEESRLSNRLSATILAFVFAAGLAGVAAAQDIKLNLTYVCNGERMYVESCNIRDTSDTSTCMVAHPDRPARNGLMAYTTETRATLKKLFPTCKQPSQQEIAAEEAFKKKQQEIYAANAAKASGQYPGNGGASNGAAGAQQSQAAALAQIAPPKNAEEREMRRCVSSGRLPATCTGNGLLGAFTQMVGQVLPSLAKQPEPGPNMAGVFVGAGGWRLDFIDGGVLVNCSFLSPHQESYRLDFKTDRTLLIIDTTPKPLLLTVRTDGTISGPGPVTINGVVAGGYTSGTSTPGHNETSTYTTTERMSANQVQPESSNTTNTYAGGGAYDVTTTHTNNNYVAGTSTPGYTNFVPKRATCPALNLHSTGTAGIQTMQTDLLKTMFGGDKGPPTPPGIRMHGIYAAATGFSVEFFPESAILGCGPDAARAYPYTVQTDGGRAAVKIAAPDHPLTLIIAGDGSLDPGSGAYQVHGRIVAGQNDDGDFTFVPLEQSCQLAMLTPSKTIPTSGGMAAAVTATNAAAAKPGAIPLATPAAPTGTAVLSLVSGFPVQAGAPNPLAGRPYVLLRDTFAGALAKAGIDVPAGMTAYKFLGVTCASRTPQCQKVIDAVQADSASAVRADSTGKGTFPGVAAGTYYLMISARYSNQVLTWDQAVELKAGQNSLALDARNGKPLQ